MSRTIGIGKQDFEKLIAENVFYVDKTKFIKEWWDNKDDVTLITRPRRFGKTLTMSMVEKFFSLDYAKRRDLFEGLSIWKEEEFRALQGTYPVISLSFANIKERDYATARRKICQLLTDLYADRAYLINSDALDAMDMDFFRGISVDMDDIQATMAIHNLSKYLNRYYGKKCIIVLDEYDTPMQEAYVGGYWDEMVFFMRSLFNASFKTNSYMEKALMTGITRINKESIFSDFNNPTVITTTSERYEDSFGFTREEVWEALKEYGLYEERENVKMWYDGFTFGRRRNIYNPWSIINYLKECKFAPYWANTSSNSLIGKLVQEGSGRLKISMEDLLSGKTIHARVDEQIVYDQLDYDNEAIWSLFLASGYLCVAACELNDDGEREYELKLTNREVLLMFKRIIRGWFKTSKDEYGAFIEALLLDDVEAMNEYMNKVISTTFSFFDTGKGFVKDTGTEHTSQLEPERFYHGFVLGLIVDLANRYRITSNRESGFGRYDVVLEPLRPEDDAMIIEFKVCRKAKKQTLDDAAKEALEQIEEKNYAANLRAAGIGPERIRKYGFAFEGKKVLIGKAGGD